MQETWPLQAQLTRVTPPSFARGCFMPVLIGRRRAAHEDSVFRVLRRLLLTHVSIIATQATYFQSTYTFLVGNYSGQKISSHLQTSGISHLERNYINQAISTPRSETKPSTASFVSDYSAVSPRNGTDDG